MPQKLDKAPKGAYDAIVFIEGSQVVAEDADGRKIASGVAGTDDTTVFQAAANNYAGVIDVGSNGLILNDTIQLQDGHIINGNGRNIDVQGLNSVLFNFVGTRKDTTSRIAGVRDVRALGLVSNTGCIFSQFNDMDYCQPIVENIYLQRVASGVWLTGDCYNSIIRDLYWLGIGPDGIGVKLTRGGGYSHNTTIDHFVAGQNWITTLGGYPLYPIWIDNDQSSINMNNIWIEGIFQHGIHTGSLSSIMVLDSVVNIGRPTPTDYVVNELDGVSRATFSNVTMVVGGTRITGACGRIDFHHCNNWTMYANYGGYLLDIQANATIEKLSIDHCEIVTQLAWPTLNFASGTNVKSFNFSDNTVSGKTTGTDKGRFLLTDATSVIGYFDMHDNIFRDIVLTPNTYWLRLQNTAGNLDGRIHSNTFRNISVPGPLPLISIVGGLEVYNNKISGCTGTITLGLCNVHNNDGHLTESSGSSTGTDSEQTIAHGLAAIPTGCKAWIKYLVGARYVTEMIPFDATNVYPTVASGVAYEWRIE